MCADIIDIAYKGKGVQKALSNFTPHAFVIDGVECASMEGVLQSLKYRSDKKQKTVCTLTDFDAKRAGERKFWWKVTGFIHWQGRRIKRDSKEFDELIARAYEQLFCNAEFRQALEEAGDCELKHTMGKHDKKKTILTEKEFIDNLNRLRNKLK